jgi:hypothetical protein
MKYGWTLYEIDNTDVNSLFEFLNSLEENKKIIIDGVEMPVKNKMSSSQVMGLIK